MKIQSNNRFVVQALGFIFNIQRYEAKFPFEIVKYNNDLDEVKFWKEVLARFQEHSDKVVREIEEVIKECEEESRQKGK